MNSSWTTLNLEVVKPSETSVTTSRHGGMFSKTCIRIKKYCGSVTYTSMEETRNLYIIVVGNLEVKLPFEGMSRYWQDVRTGE